MRAEVVFEDDEGAHHVVGHGGLIGRLGTAELVLRDGRISEAHAMVSLRGSALQLLALRGRFAVQGKAETQLRLAPGQSIFLARGLSLRVVEVRLPRSVLTVGGPGLVSHVLSGVTSIVRRPDLRAVAGLDPDALATFWNHDEAWMVRVGERAPVSVDDGDVVDAAGVMLSLQRIPLQRAGGSATMAQGRIDQPIEIFARFDTVQICQGGEERLRVGGLSARLISELVSFEGPVPWAVLAGELWATSDRKNLRKNLDQVLYRLRNKLEGAQIRTNLVTSIGDGHLELALQPGDTVHDLT